MPNFTVLCGDAIQMLRTLPDESIDCCITSPPYWQLRDFGVEGDYGLESDWHNYLNTMTTVFGEVRRVLKPTGTLFINIGDKYFYPQRGIAKSSVQAKSLVCLPWRLAIRMVDDGWILRNVIVWYKPDRLPESVRDRFTCSWEPVFFFVRSQKYAFNLDSVRIRQPTGPSLFSWDALDNSAKYREAEDMGKRRSGARKQYAPRSKEMPRLATVHPMGKNPGDVWSISHSGEYQGYHEAKYPERLVLPMILAGCPENGTVLDPFCGTGTTLVVALRLGRNAVGIDIAKKYCDITRKRCEEVLSRPNLFDQSSWGPSRPPVDNSGPPVDNSRPPVDNLGLPVDNSGPEHEASG